MPVVGPRAGGMPEGWFDGDSTGRTGQSHTQRERGARQGWHDTRGKGNNRCTLGGGAWTVCVYVCVLCLSSRGVCFVCVAVVCVVCVLCV